MKTVVVGGGFDPLHRGHLALFRHARTLGDELLVIVESDDYVGRKHEVMLPQSERAAILRHIKGIDEVIENDDPNGDDSRILEQLRLQHYVVGPDHADGKFPERATCERLGIEWVARPPDGTEGIHSSAMLARSRYKSPIPVVAAVIRGWEGTLIARRSIDKLWEIPGGFMEVGETPEQAIERELFEETKLTFYKPPQYVGSVVGKYYDGREIVVLAFKGVANGKPQATAECLDFWWVKSLDEVVFSHQIDRRILLEYGGLQ